MVTNDAKCTREIKSKIAMAKAAFNKIFTSKLDLNLRNKLYTEVEASLLQLIH
jgi:hypothetical protein